MRINNELTRPSLKHGVIPNDGVCFFFSLLDSYRRLVTQICLYHVTRNRPLFLIAYSPTRSLARKPSPRCGFTPVQTPEIRSVTTHSLDHSRKTNKGPQTPSSNGGVQYQPSTRPSTKEGGGGDEENARHQLSGSLFFWEHPSQS